MATEDFCESIDCESFNYKKKQYIWQTKTKLLAKI
jgi:hypothetical protein